MQLYLCMRSATGTGTATAGRRQTHLERGGRRHQLQAGVASHGSAGVCQHQLHLKVERIDWIVAQAEGLQVGQVEGLRDGIDRHGQMIHNRAFDVAEFSMSTFLMAIDRGLPIIGIPVFPRRLFSQSCFFVRADSDIEHPRDLVGRRVGLLSFQTTLSLLAKGDHGDRHLMVLPAYDQCIKASHRFNLLDARGVISVTERQSYILRVRELAKACGAAWLKTEAGGAA